MFDEFQKTTFATPVSNVKDISTKKELCEFSSASIENLKEIVGDEIDFEKNIDLLSVAFPITVVNQFNENGEALVSPIAAEIKDYFKHKPTNIEHKAQKVVGHMVNVSFNELDSYSIIDSKKISKRKDPFYLSASAVLYKMGNPNFIDIIKRSVDPQDELYQYISASWEVIFKYWAVGIGSKNVKDCEIFTDPKDILKYKKYLKKFGGPGKLPDGKPVGRIVLGPALPVGIGFTTNPAANVKGVFADLENEEIDGLIDSKTLLRMDNKEVQEIFNTANSKSNKDFFDIFDIKNKKISQLNKNTVNISKSNTMDELEKQIQTLSEKVGSFEEYFKTENAEKAKASLIKVFEDTLREKNEEWIAKIEAEKAKAEKEKEERENIVKSLASLEEKVKDYQSKVEALEAEKSEAAKQELINSRMDVITEEYELSSAAKKSVVSQLKEIGEKDEDFENFKKNFLEVSYASFNKEAIKQAEAKRQEEIEAKAKELLAAETEKIKASVEKASGLSFEEILSRASEETPSVPNSSSAEGELDLVDKIVKSLKKENISVK